AARICARQSHFQFANARLHAPQKSRTRIPKQSRAQREFKNRPQSCSRRGNEAEVFFPPSSASLRRRLPFLSSPWSGAPPGVFVIAGWSFCGVWSLVIGTFILTTPST